MDLRLYSLTNTPGALTHSGTDRDGSTERDPVSTA